jgi:long-chain acyl-CoA synthetase
MPTPAPVAIERLPETTMTQRFVRQLRSRPDEVALRERVTADDGSDAWRELTWSDYAEQACRVAGALRDIGVQRGDRVVIVLRNRPEFHVLDLGCLLVGATPVSLYNSSAPEQLAYLIGHCRAEVAVFDDPEFLARFESVRDQLPRVRHVAVIDDRGDDLPAGVARWSDLVGAEPVDLDTAAAIAQPDDLLTIIYTSGTTGPPKGVSITHENMCWVIDSIRTADPTADVSHVGWRLVSYLPMAHIAERMASHYEAMQFGFEVTTCPETTLVASYLGPVRPNLLFGVPRVWEKLYAGLTAMAKAGPDGGAAMFDAVSIGLAHAQATLRGEKLSDEDQAAYEAAVPTLELVRSLVGIDQVELAVSSAAACPPHVQEFLLGIGLPFIEIYGMSECTGPMTWSLPETYRPGWVGIPMPGSEVRLADDGEVLCRGGHVFGGYLDDPERTAEALDADGWLHSGDIGELDPDGYLRIVDRKKELIITAGGKNISPANIEMLLKASPLVGQACVIGDGRAFLSAVVVLDPDVAPVWAKQHGVEGLSLEELAEHPDVRAEVERAVHDDVNVHLNGVEQVKRFLLVGDEWLPDSDVLTPTSKLKRRGVLSRYGDRIEALYQSRSY